MYGLTNASKGVQGAATQDDINTAVAGLKTHTDAADETLQDNIDTVDAKVDTSVTTLRSEIATAKSAAISDAKDYTESYTASYTATYVGAHHGYPVVTTTTGLAWNTELRLSNVTTVSVTMPASPDMSTDAQTHELRVILKLASSGTISVTFSANTGQVIKWPDDQPTWSSAAGKLYEISFSPIYTDGSTTYIVAYAKEIDLS